MQYPYSNRASLLRTTCTVGWCHQVCRHDGGADCEPWSPDHAPPTFFLGGGHSRDALGTFAGLYMGKLDSAPNTPSFAAALELALGSGHSCRDLEWLSVLQSG